MCRLARIRPASELASHRCGVTENVSPLLDGADDPRPGVLAGVGTEGEKLFSAGDNGRAGAVPPLCPSAPPTAVGGIFLPPGYKKTEKQGIERKISLYNRRYLCYSNLVRGGEVCPPPLSLASPGGDTCPGAACGVYF